MAAFLQTEHERHLSSEGVTLPDVHQAHDPVTGHKYREHVQSVDLTGIGKIRVYHYGQVTQVVQAYN